MRIGVIGGGITGLVCAYYLVREGHQPVVFESRPYLGARGPRPASAGTSTGIATENVPAPRPTRASESPEADTEIKPAPPCSLDPFPITLLRSDSATCALIAELGLTQELQWHITRAGVSSGQSMYPLSGWSDILRYGKLSMLQRVRAAASGLAGIKLRNYARPLDSIQVRDWFVERQGEAMYEALWRPAIGARFGFHHVDDMPAYVAWQFLREELAGSSRMVGALRGGVGTFYKALARTVMQRGGELRLRTRVHGIEADERKVIVDVGHGRVELDVVISAIKLPALAEIINEDLSSSLPRPARTPRMQQVTSVRSWRRGRSPLQGYYRMLMFDRNAPFPVLIDGTPLLPREERRDRSVTYLLRLDPGSDPSQLMSDEDAQVGALATLRDLDPSVDPSQLEDVSVFRWKSPDPIWTVDSLSNPTPERLGKTPIHICTASQAYPKGASPESVLLLARACVGRVVREHGAA